MTYSPGNQPGAGGFPPAQPPGSYGAPTQSFASAAEPGPSKLPMYLSVAVVVLGLAAYLSSFGPVFTSSAELGPISVESTSGGGVFLTLATLLAALLAAVGLLPRARGQLAIVAILSVLGVLIVVSQLFNISSYVTTGWAAWLVLVFAVLQAVVAISALLLEAGVIKAPAPKPKYEQPQYGQYGPPGGYYGQAAPQAPPQHPGQQGGRPGYPSQYGGYGTPSTGGFGAYGSQSENGPPTPPTGYPSFSPPPAVGSGQHTAPTPTQQPQAEPSAPSPGPNPS